jgi:hypothetical protein
MIMAAGMERGEDSSGSPMRSNFFSPPEKRGICAGILGVIIDTTHLFCSYPAVKFSTSLLPLALLASTLSACATPVPRRDVFSPNHLQTVENGEPVKGNGYWTKKLHEREAHEGIFGISNSEPYHFQKNSGIFGISHSHDN